MRRLLMSHSAGNCTDTGNNAADFSAAMPADPRDLNSLPTP